MAPEVIAREVMAPEVVEREVMAPEVMEREVMALEVIAADEVISADDAAAAEVLLAVVVEPEPQAASVRARTAPATRVRARFITLFCSLEKAGTANRWPCRVSAWPVRDCTDPDRSVWFSGGTGGVDRG